ncbi:MULTISPECIES: Lrp/AsnC family transcriptional regulator [Mycolicibacterium]|uniref:AsnC family transcriptional regulator n=1 Tax=Mycolicibacterium fortuitum TaxID=1766 RepID=A0ABD6QR19_MYCFO|nr:MULTISPECIES: Lrp/AsnC family transcriptional regulator [Mycolicibacterium]OBB34254.1 AsnC family transcriptional regulator [Mycolicibacterium fortuitum]OBB41836.1 AsnC family transcriptional regulator [Mycolicibacterium fortuitum]OBB55431.1 AsnC family transcriptional regulator [Mycolicibacterium fortuitum]OBF75518.1 AsnC family transcriptional regulator [Mycolicibacterium fortuitum]OBG25676.1 AsnC family transcriptional regulator [Mycolicibacterium fortuitum]
MRSLDKLDSQLLRMLMHDARTGVMELSSKLGVSRNTIQSRLRRLEEMHLVVGYQPVLDLEKAGFAVQAFISIEIEQGRLTSVVDQLTAIAAVLEIHTTTGRNDLLVRVATATQAELQRLIERVVAVPGVVHASTTLSLTNPLRMRVDPLLDQITRDAGWGRSTPSPKGR